MGEIRLNTSLDDEGHFTSTPAWTGPGGPRKEQLYVRPRGRAWSVDGQGLEPLIFGRGAAAEAHARRVAKALAQLGCDATVQIYDAADQIAGSIHYYAIDGRLKAAGRDRYPWAT